MLYICSELEGTREIFTRKNLPWTTLVLTDLLYDRVHSQDWKLISHQNQNFTHPLSGSQGLVPMSLVCGITPVYNLTGLFHNLNVWLELFGQHWHSSRRRSTTLSIWNLVSLSAFRGHALYKRYGSLQKDVCIKMTVGQYSIVSILVLHKNLIFNSDINPILKISESVFIEMNF